MTRFIPDFQFIPPAKINDNDTLQWTGTLGDIVRLLFFPIYHDLPNLLEKRDFFGEKTRGTLKRRWRGLDRIDMRPLSDASPHRVRYTASRNS